MQQTKSYWYLLAAFGVISACAGAACTVTTSTVDTTAGAAGEDTAGTSSAGTNNAGTGGASAGAAGVTAGAAGATAGAAGTAAATGGTGGVDPTTVPQCDVTAGGSSDGSDTPTGTPAATCSSGITDACSTCVQQNCCAEYSQCFGTSPGNVCGFGGPNNEGEFPCYQACLQAAFTKNGGSLDESDRGTCANGCLTSTATMGALDCGSSIGTATNALIGCLMDNNCNTACYGG